MSEVACRKSQNLSIDKKIDFVSIFLCDPNGF